MNDPADQRQKRDRDSLGPNSEIGTKLRALYGTIADQPIPDKFLQLLERLERAEQNSGKIG